MKKIKIWITSLFSLLFPIAITTSCSENKKEITKPMVEPNEHIIELEKINVLNPVTLTNSTGNILSRRFGNGFITKLSNTNLIIGLGERGLVETQLNENNEITFSKSTTFPHNIVEANETNKFIPSVEGGFILKSAWNHIIIGTHDQGIYEATLNGDMSIDHNSISHIPMTNNIFNQKFIPNTEGGFILSMTNKTILIGTHDQGLYQAKITDNGEINQYEIVHLPFSPLDDNGIPQRHIPNVRNCFAIKVSDKRVLIGTHIGIYQVNLNDDGFINMNSISIIPNVSVDNLDNKYIPNVVNGCIAYVKNHLIIGTRNNGIYEADLNPYTKKVNLNSIKHIDLNGVHGIPSVQNGFIKIVNDKVIIGTNSNGIVAAKLDEIGHIIVSSIIKLPKSNPRIVNSDGSISIGRPIDLSKMFSYGSIEVIDNIVCLVDKFGIIYQFSVSALQFD